MSAPILWIGLPGIVSVLLWFMRKEEHRTLLIGLGASLFFILTSIFFPIGQPIFRIGSFVLQISPTISILGRSFTIGNGDLVYTTLLFLILFLFLSMSFVVDIPVRFVPIGFLITTLILAALSVQPFLYAALLLEICVILSVILLSSVGKTPTTGVMRFLIFQSLAMPFMLASGWVLSAVQANPTETTLIFQALILLGLGFAFWLGVYPFNSWMPQIAEEKPPFLVGFILLMFNTATLILVIRYLDGFVWLRDDARIFLVFRIMGLLMVVSGSILFAMERKIFRTVAYLISFETGLSLISLSLNQSAGWNSFTLMFLPRILAVALWAGLLSYLQQSQKAEDGENILHPVIPIGFSISAFTISGLPLFPEFISRLPIFTGLAQSDLSGLLWIGIAHIIFIFGTIRFLIRLYSNYSFLPDTSMTKMEKGYFFVFSGLILLMGVLPQFFLPGVLNMLQAFPNIK